MAGIANTQPSTELFVGYHDAVCLSQLMVILVRNFSQIGSPVAALGNLEVESLSQCVIKHDPRPC